MPCPEILAVTTYRVPAAIAVLGLTLSAADHSFGVEALAAFFEDADELNPCRP